MAKKPARKIDINAFPEKVVVKEMSLTRKDLKLMYERVVNTLNDSFFDEDGVEMSVADVLELVDEKKFAAFVAKEMGAYFNILDVNDVIDTIAGYDLMGYDIPDRVSEVVKKSKAYKSRVVSTEEQEREREIARVISQAERLGLTVTR